MPKNNQHEITAAPQDDIELARQIIWMFLTMQWDLAQHDHYMVDLLNGRNLTNQIQRTLSQALQCQMEFEKQDG